MRLASISLAHGWRTVKAFIVLSLHVQRLNTAPDQHLHHGRRDRVAVLPDLVTLAAQDNVVLREGHRPPDLVRLQHAKVAVFNPQAVAGIDQSVPLQRRDGAHRSGDRRVDRTPAVIAGQERHHQPMMVTAQW